MTVQHDRRRPARVHLGHAVPGHVRRDLVRERAGFGAPDTRGHRLEPGRRGRIEEALEERDGRRTEHRHDGR